MTEWQSKCVDNLVDRIDALLIMRVERDTRERHDPDAYNEACDDMRVAIADAITDLMAAAKD